MIPQDSDKHFDPAAVCASLATQAVLLEARLYTLQGAVDAVDARIKEVTDTLRRLNPTPPTSAEAGDDGDRC